MRTTLKKPPNWYNLSAKERSAWYQRNKKKQQSKLAKILFENLLK